jgi:hypothetical protein
MNSRNRGSAKEQLLEHSLLMEAGMVDGCREVRAKAVQTRLKAEAHPRSSWEQSRKYVGSTYCVYAELLSAGEKRAPHMYAQLAHLRRLWRKNSTSNWLESDKEIAGLQLTQNRVS